MRRSPEAFWWSLFSAGGVMAAIFMPALVLVTGFLLPFREGAEAGAGYEHVHGIVSFWLMRLVLFGVLALTLFHCAHRIRHILLDLGLRGLGTPLSVGCYGLAFLGTGVAGYLLLTV